MKNNWENPQELVGGLTSRLEVGDVSQIRTRRPHLQSLARRGFHH